MVTLLSLWLTLSGAASAAAGPSFKKVMIVVLENTSYQDARNQKYLQELAGNGALLTNYHAVGHPSQPNYIALISGDTQGVYGDGNADVDARHVGDLLEDNHKTWKVYAEEYPGKPGECFLGSRSGKYVRKHTPFISFKNVQSDPNRCSSHIVEASALDADIQNGTLPDYSLYIPNLDHDGHDTSPFDADQWLSSAFGARLKDPKFMQDMLFVVTFDEDDSLFGPNQVYAVLYGPSVVPGEYPGPANNPYNHYSLLRTIENAFGLVTLTSNDANAAPITGIWK